MPDKKDPTMINNTYTNTQVNTPTTDIQTTEQNNNNNNNISSDIHTTTESNDIDTKHTTTETKTNNNKTTDNKDNSDNKDNTITDLATDLRDLQIDYITKQKGDKKQEAYNKLYPTLLQAFPTYLPLLSLKIDVLNEHKQRETMFTQIIDACNQLIQTIDRDKLAAHYGRIYDKVCCCYIYEYIYISMYTPIAWQSCMNLTY